MYRAHDGRHDRDVAIKVLHPELAATLGTERFLKEITISARLNHPHILTLIDSGTAASFLYYVMPFVRGESLRARLTRKRRLPYDTALPLIAEVADALEYAHREGVVHRDVKPENILLSEGHAVVSDFGIAKAVSSAVGPGLTQTGFPVGTPGYMSPEQAAGMPDLDARTDVYSLACVCYEVLAGEPPRRWLTEEAVARGRFLDAPQSHRAVLDRLPEGAEGAMVQALQLRADRRTASPRAFVEDLRADPAPHAARARRSYEAREVQDILRRAAESDAAAVTVPPTPGLTIGGIEEAASEAGIPREHVRRAAKELEGGDGSGTVGASWFLGAPARIIIERVVEGEVPEREIPELMEEIRTAYGIQGYVSRLDRSATWRARRPKRSHEDGDSLSETINKTIQDAWPEQPPNIMVRIVCRAGRTHIRLERTLAEAARGIFGGIIGGLGLGGMAVALALGIAVAGSPSWAMILAGTAAVGSFALSRGIFLAVRKRRQRELTVLADRLAAHVAETSQWDENAPEDREVPT